MTAASPTLQAVRARPRRSSVLWAAVDRRRLYRYLEVAADRDGSRRRAPTASPAACRPCALAWTQAHHREFIVVVVLVRSRSDRRRQKLTTVQLRLEQCFRVMPPQSVFDAATSHAWNNGTPPLHGSSGYAGMERRQTGSCCRRLAFSDSA